MDPQLQFAYWPRYVARILRFRAVYCKELLGWKFKSEQTFQRPDKKTNEYREEPYLPVWRFTEHPPWNIANRLSSFPYPDVNWCVETPDDGEKVARKLSPMPADEQLVFKGDRVKVLVGPDKGKIGLVASVLKMRRMVLVENLNYRVSHATGSTLRRDELPLCLDNEVALVDPVDNEPCSPTWRYNEQGERLRISMRTGRLIPLPTLARQLDDLTDPKSARTGTKDTTSAIATKVTFHPTKNRSVSFERDLSAQYGIECDQKRFPTYWY